VATDISIEDLRKAMVRPDASPRARANDRLKAQAFIDDPSIKIVEKIDGTKLTLIRRNNEFDPADYAKNWYIAYKGNIIYSGEIKDLKKREEEVRSTSSGTAQYSLIHSHMARIHKDTGSIPQGTEFFLEFVQRKPTITRDYPQKHGIFLTLFGPSRYKVTRAQLVSNISPVDDDDKLKEYASILDFRTYPVLFEGSVANLMKFGEGIRSVEIQKRFADSADTLKKAYNDSSQDRPLKIIDAVYEIFSKFNTSLSSEADDDESRAAEGSVFKTSITKALYKALRPDQHSFDVRSAVKLKYRANAPEEEQAYWDGIIAIADQVSSDIAPNQHRNIHEDDLNAAFEALHKKCYFNAAITNRVISLRHPKLLIQRQEDLFLTAKNIMMKRFEIGTQNGITIGIFVLAGKPVHDGHWKMIGRAAKECDEAIIITSSAGRDELPAGVMIDAWKAVLEPQFYKDFPNATLIISSESPLSIAVHKIKSLKNVVSKFFFYTDDEDAVGKFSVDKIAAMVKDPLAMEKFVQVPIPRSQTIQISGTEVRNFLNDNDHESFNMFVPQTLSDSMKDKYWSILKAEYGQIKDSRQRKSILANLWENLERK